MNRFFTIPASAPFLPTLADALLTGRVIPEFPGADPLALADATVYLPTQRAARAFGRALVRASGRPGLVLPRITPLGAFSEESDFLDADAGEPLDERLAVGELQRRMTLARLVAAWGDALKGAIRRVGADGRLETDATEAPLIAATPAQALSLAGDLAALIDDMRIEGVGFERLATLAGERFDPYWRITLDFLKIAFDAWPAWTEEQGLLDRAERTQRAVAREIAALAAGARGPTIVAGSTGTNSAVAELIGAVARSPRGAVVLPDLDRELDAAAWKLVADGDDPTAATHPQAALARLLARLGVARDGVEPLAPPRPRARLLREAMRPAETTDAWRQASPEAGAALEGLALIEADHEAEEALAIAVALRETLETPGRTAALITPDPAIARRVAAELLRWDIEVENSAGATLGDTPGGRFARLAAAAACEFSPPRVAALLASPLVQLGREPEARARAVRALELGVLRAPLPLSGLVDIDAALAAGRAAARAPYAHRAAAGLSDADVNAAEALLRDLADALAPLRNADEAPLAELVAAHRTALEKLAAPDPVDEPVADLIDEWALACGEGFVCGLGDYVAMFETLAAVRAPPGPRGHPRLALIGLLEARLLKFDRVVLAGLDETVWPPAAHTDAFLNREMRAELKLSAPERRIGQTAHDFVAALGTEDAVVTRARKRGGSPTVESRFLRRLEAVAGEQPMSAARDRGRHYLELARWLDRPAVAAPAARPNPKPPLALRPLKLSVTRIETLRRDPYAIFAERILRLAPLPPIGPEIGPAEIGSVWHAVLEAFVKGAAKGESMAAVRSRLEAIAEAQFAVHNADPAFRALRWPRMRKALDKFLEFDARRRAETDEIFIEETGEISIALVDGARFSLTARADRIEIGRDGFATVIDYKTGAPPGVAEVRVGFAPQLTLEAAMIRRGGFACVPAVETAAAIYWKLGGVAGGVERRITFDDGTFAEIAELHFEGLEELLNSFRDPGQGYMSQPYAKFAGRSTDYDHLARVAEWALAEGEDT